MSSTMWSLHRLILFYTQLSSFFFFFQNSLPSFRSIFYAPTSFSTLSIFHFSFFHNPSISCHPLLFPSPPFPFIFPLICLYRLPSTPYLFALFCISPFHSFHPTLQSYYLLLFMFAPIFSLLLLLSSSIIVIILYIPHSPPPLPRAPFLAA